MFFPCGAGAVVHGVSKEKKKEEKCVRKTVVIIVNLYFLVQIALNFGF